MDERVEGYIKRGKGLLMKDRRRCMYVLIHEVDRWIDK